MKKPEQKRVLKWLDRVIRKKHEEHAKLPGDKLIVKRAELRNYSLEA